MTSRLPLLITLIFLHPAFADPPTFDSCQPGVNDYLEPSLKKENLFTNNKALNTCLNDSAPGDFSTLASLLKRANEGLPVECIVGALKKNIQPGGTLRYGFCGKSGQEKPTEVLPTCLGTQPCYLPPPCVSPRYVSLVYNSFTQSMRCLGLNEKELFPVFGIESYYEMNIGNTGGDWGIAQLSPPALLALDWKSKFASLSRRPECAQLKNALSRPMSSKATPCERIELPLNPSRSFIYGGTMYIINKSIAKTAIEKLKSRRKSPITSAQVEKLTVDLTRYMYNAGAGGVKQAFLSFIEENQNADLEITTLEDQFSEYLKNHYGEGLAYFKTHEDLQKKIRGTVPGYAKWVNGFAQHVSSAMGVECLNP